MIKSMIFELKAQFIHENASAIAERQGRMLVVRTTTHSRRVRDLSQAIRLACEAVGPLMERGDKTGEGWGLLVTVGTVCVAYGNWPAGSPGRPDPRLEDLRRILAEYHARDGARAALANATKVIEALTKNPRQDLREAA
jgi:nitroreductase